MTKEKHGQDAWVMRSKNPGRLFWRADRGLCVLSCGRK